MTVEILDDTTADQSRGRFANAAPPALLLAVWFLLVFSYGGYLQRQWLLPGLGIAAFGVVVFALKAYPRRPRSLSIGVLTLFALYTIWVALSGLWAGSLEGVWDETARSGVYLVTLGIALTYFADRRSRLAFRYLLLFAGMGLFAVVVQRLWHAGPDDLALMFPGNRFAYPVSYANNAAALLLTLFWPLIWMAADPRARASVRGLALGTASGLLCLSVLTQSRGALWALVITTIITFMLTPARLRTVLFLLAPLGVLIWGFPGLNQYWVVGAVETGGLRAAEVALEGFAIAAGVGWVLAVLERWVKVSRRMRAGFGLVVVVGTMAALTYGYVSLEAQVGDVGSWMADSWRRFTAEEVTTLPTPDQGVQSDAPGGSGQKGAAPRPTSRFATVSTSGRWDIWRVAWRTFRGDPWIGVGAGNFVYSYDRLRRYESAKIRQPHSIELRALAETGLVGATLLFGSFFLGVTGALWPRSSSAWQHMRGVRRGRRDPGAPDDDDTLRGPNVEFQGGRWGLDSAAYSWETALIVGFLYWLVHGSVEWMWHMPATTIAPLLLMAAAVASVDARAEIMWPRWAQLLRALPGRLVLLVPPLAHVSRRRATARDSSNTPLLPTTATGGDGIYPVHRRVDRYSAKRSRRDRRRARQADAWPRLHPPGPLSAWFRRVALTLSVLTVVATALPYLALRYEDSALRNAAASRETALGQARFAARLLPVSAHPAIVQADIYETSARASAQAGKTHRGALLDALALSLDARQRALELEEPSWSLWYSAGLAALALADEQRVAESTVAHAPTARPGEDPLSPATTEEEIEVATRLRTLTPDDLEFLARTQLEAARVRNPLSPEVATALAESYPE